MIFHIGIEEGEAALQRNVNWSILCKIHSTSLLPSLSPSPWSAWPVLVGHGHGHGHHHQLDQSALAVVVGHFHAAIVPPTKGPDPPTTPSGILIIIIITIASFMIRLSEIFIALAGAKRVMRSLPVKPVKADAWHKCLIFGYCAQ